MRLLPTYPLLLSLLGLLPRLAASHGYLSSPPARQAGAATALACGKPITDAILRDNTSHIEGLPELAARSGPDNSFSAAACNLWLCRGIQFADNAERTQTWRPGQTVRAKVRLTIPHDGSANVSIVDTARNEVVGDMLVVWPTGYANEKEFFAGSLPLNNTEFNVTLPDVSGRCGRAGDCVSLLVFPLRLSEGFRIRG
jgi:predicted carbohydrate-binding protein with CBM5 and CBM33 domain